MTEAQARTTANVLLATAVVGAAYYVLKTPPLRRKVWELARSWAAGPLVVWTATEFRRAWDGSAANSASGPARPIAGGDSTTMARRPTPAPAMHIGPGPASRATPPAESHAERASVRQA